ncbi:MAG: ATP-binding protein [Gammaproteobacteria bacterium]|nr:ATP-binding protein [Gammaproteobacteria bacterium]
MQGDTVKIVLHIDEELDQVNREQIEQAVSQSRGIVAAHINDKRHHLMLVDYEPQQLNTTEVLNQVIQQGVHAELVGGI